MKNLFLMLVSTLLLTMRCTTPSEDDADMPVPQENQATFRVVVSTIAGKVHEKGNAQDGTGTDARFWNPTKLVYDQRNQLLYVADGSVIRSIDEQNNVRTYLPLKALGSTFNEILDMAPAPGAAGSLYVTTKENDLWKIEPDGSQGKAINLVNRIYGGNATGKLNSDDHFDRATGLATGKSGEIYFFNQSYNTLHRILLSSGMVEPFAGKPLLEAGGNGSPYPFVDGQGEQATFGGRVADIDSDGSGNVYIADFDNELIRKVTPEGQVTSLFSYQNRIGVDVDGPVSKARSNNVTQVAVTADGKFVFFSSLGNAANNLSSLRLVRPGKEVSTLVGYSSSYGDGTGKTAGLGEIGGIAATPDGKTIYVSEPGMKVIRKVVFQ